MKITLVLCLLYIGCFQTMAQSSVADNRNIRNGVTIPSEGYCDQPYIVKNEDGSWTCVMTTGSGMEGESGQHLVASITKNQGKTWSPLIDIEPANGPAASWGMPLKTPYGRIYIFYTYNSKNIDKVPQSPKGVAKRVDTHGVYAYKYSDDNGLTWSKKHYEIPVREMDIDRRNNFNGEVRQFWGVGKPIIAGDTVYFGFAKVGKWGIPGVMITSEGCFMKSPNILTEKNVEKIVWETLPDGDHGLRAPKGPVADEANLVVLSDGTLYCTYRTIDGFNCHAYSRDGGHTWTSPAYATYTPGGRKIKHPRAYNPVRKFSNGKYLLWFHNHGGQPLHTIDGGWNYYKERNPVWIAGGIEKDGFIHWSQPEILLYDDDPAIRISYPDFVEENGKYFVSETQKSIARIHEIDSKILEAIWGQFENTTVTKEGLVLELSEEDIKEGKEITMPELPNLEEGGFTVDFWMNLEHLTAGQVILDNMHHGKGIKIATTANWTLALTIADGLHQFTWESDPGVHEGTLKAGKDQHIAIVVDGKANIVSFVVNGQLNDGGDTRQFGWGRFTERMGDVNGSSKVSVVPTLFHDGKLKKLRVYNRYLLTSEAVGNYQAEKTLFENIN